MIKTLRITSVIAAILAGVLFFFPVIFGVRSDELIDEFLKQPSVKEKFEDVSDTKAKAGESRVSPLVEQAEAFALYLNPVNPVVQKPSKTTTKPTTISDRVAVTPKFPVYATIYFEGNPELSQALIDEPGRERRWVKQSSQVGHLFIEQIKDGVVVVTSGGKTFDILLEEKPEATNITNRTSISSPKTSSSVRGRASVPPAGRTPTSSVARRPIITPRTPNTSTEDQEKMGQLVDKLKDLQSDAKSDTSGLSGEERAARIQELISKFKSTQVGAEESKKLGNLGEKLKDAPEDKNQSAPVTNLGKVEADTPKTEKADE